MRFFKQAILILSIYLIGIAISEILNLPLPGNIVGMIILLSLLCSNIIKLHHIERISNFFLDNLAFFFIPAGVGIIDSLNIIKGNILNIIIICIITTAIIIAVTGRIVQFLNNKTNKITGGK